MKSQTLRDAGSVRILRQRGIVLFFALIALVAMSLAAMALIRSVDTNTLIAGNLAFRQAATTSADAGIESAITALRATEQANATINVLNNPEHPFNISNAEVGYYSNVDPAISLTADGIWGNGTSCVAGGASCDDDSAIDGSGNQVRYIVQRMCRNANVAIQNADCMFSGALQDNNGQAIPLPQDICSGDGCPVAGQAPQIRITARVTGPRNTVSYVQAYVY